MADDEVTGDYLTALTTEHFVLQTQAASTIAESNSRSSMYLMALSSLLVALGFTASTGAVFPYLAGAGLPAVFVLGCFTILRLVDTTIENLGYQTRILRIHEAYARLAPGGRHNFPVSTYVGNEAQVRYRVRHRFPMLTTTASTIGAVNAIVGGAAVAYLARLVGLALTAAAVIGVVIAFALFALVIVYQRRRFVDAHAGPVEEHGEGDLGRR